MISDPARLDHCRLRCLARLVRVPPNFIVAVLSFCGFALGSFIGTRVGPLLVPRGSASPYAPAFGLIGALLAGAILATGFEGVGHCACAASSFYPELDLLDGAWSALLKRGLGRLAIAWILAALSSCKAPQLRSLYGADVQRSAILERAQPVVAAHRSDPARLGEPPIRSLRSQAYCPRISAPPPAIAHNPGVLAASSVSNT